MEKLKFTIKPYWSDNTVTAVDINAKIAAETIKGKKPALDFCSDAWENLIPFPEYEELKVSDDMGEIPFEIRESPSNWGGINYKGLYFKREVKGQVCYSYRIYPRILPEGYRSSPYYDFRNEPYGLNGSGCFAFILPYTTENLLFDLQWDMSEMPKDARAIWSYGRGDTKKELTPWDIRFTFFACGVMECEEEGDFGIYWFGEPTFNVRSVTKRLAKLFEYMAEFFQDNDSEYRIILRRDPFEYSGGGSAAARSFISGYSALGTVDVEEWYATLAHEMVHNWPFFDDTVTGTGTWYSEGIAEYYSTVLPYRAGFLDAEYTVRQMNRRGKERYLDNIYREVPNMEIPAIQWKDRRAQTVPYGRDFVYLSNVEAQLNRAGKGSIDEITVLYTMPKKSLMTEMVWTEFIRERLGEEGLKEFEDMKAGKLVIPDKDGFGEAFTVVEDEIELDGRKEKTYRWILR